MKKIAEKLQSKGAAASWMGPPGHCLWPCPVPGSMDVGIRFGKSLEKADKMNINDRRTNQLSI